MDIITTAAVTYTPPATSIVHNAQVSLTSRSPASVVHLTQYDTTMPIIAVAPTANGQPYTVPSGAAVNVRLAKPDGTYVYNPAYGLSEDRQTVYIAVTVQMTVCSGRLAPIVEVVIDGGVAATGFFILDIDPNPIPEDAIASTDEYKTIQQLAAEVAQAAQVVQDNLAGIQYVQQNAASITAVAQNGAAVSAVAENVSDVNTVAQNLTPIQTASENITAIQQAPTAATNAAASATLAESWAVGGTGTREGENTNNAQYWAGQAQAIAQGALGWYESDSALQAAHPTGQNGQWAIVGTTDTIWTWDSDTAAWVDTGSQMDLSGYYTKEQSDERYATAAQGKKADTAVQSVNGVQASAGAVTIPVGTKMTLLWTNPNVKQMFAPQKISLGLSGYTMVLILSSWNTVGGQISDCLYAPVGAQSRMTSCIQFNAYRDANVSTSGVSFGSGTRYPIYNDTPSTDNGVCVPARIYGINL